MFNWFKKKKPKEKSCVNCSFYNKRLNKCLKTNNSTLRAFPFKNTTCKIYKEK